MGDTGASGVAGAFYIIGIIALIPILIGALSCLPAAPAPQNMKKRDRVGPLRLGLRVVLCIILIPVLIVAGYVGYEVAKAKIEAKWRQQDDEMRARNAEKQQPH